MTWVRLVPVPSESERIKEHTVHEYKLDEIFPTVVCVTDLWYVYPITSSA